MKNRKRPKNHLPGDHACEARQIWLALRDQPDSFGQPGGLRRALVEAMRRGQAAPCDPSRHA